jgi:hypothetical protein
MTIEDLIISLEKYRWALLIAFCAFPLAALLGTLIQGKRECAESKTRYLYAVLIYLTCIPGMFAAVLTAYSMFFLRANVLRLNLFVYFLPIVSMAATLIIIKNKNSFNDIPGFGRIQGLMIMLATSFAVAFFVYRMVIFIGFFGSMTNLLVVAILVFILMKMGARKLKSR